MMALQIKWDFQLGEENWIIQVSFEFACILLCSQFKYVAVVKFSQILQIINLLSVIISQKKLFDVVYLARSFHCNSHAIKIATYYVLLMISCLKNPLCMFFFSRHNVDVLHPWSCCWICCWGFHAELLRGYRPD